VRTKFGSTLIENRRLPSCTLRATKLGGTIFPPLLLLSAYPVIGHLLVLVENHEIGSSVVPLVYSKTILRVDDGVTVIASEPQIVSENGSWCTML
jgi:hypothetical protein